MQWMHIPTQYDFGSEIFRKEKLNRNEEEILGNNNPQQFTHPVVS